MLQIYINYSTIEEEIHLSLLRKIDSYKHYFHAIKKVLFKGLIMMHLAVINNFNKCINTCKSVLKLKLKC